MRISEDPTSAGVVPGQAQINRQPSMPMPPDLGDEGHPGTGNGQTLDKHPAVQ